MKLKKLNILVLLLFTQAVLAQVTFKTTVSKTELGLNERLRIEFSINKQGGDDFTPPNFNNFKGLIKQNKYICKKVKVEWDMGYENPYP